MLQGLLLVIRQFVDIFMPFLLCITVDDCRSHCLFLSLYVPVITPPPPKKKKEKKKKKPRTLPAPAPATSSY